MPLRGNTPLLQCSTPPRGARRRYSLCQLQGLGETRQGQGKLSKEWGLSENSFLKATHAHCRKTKQSRYSHLSDNPTLNFLFCLLRNSASEIPYLQLLTESFKLSSHSRAIKSHTLNNGLRRNLSCGLR